MIGAYPIVFVAVVASQLASSHGEPMAAALTMLLFAPIPIGMWWWGLRTWVKADDSGVTVRNPLSLRHIAYEEIVSCTPSYNGLVIRTTSGVVVAFAVQKSNLAKWFHIDTRADDVARFIGDRARRARSGQ